jgi:two-component system heavy metal sensor histidine kinase CusS
VNQHPRPKVSRASLAVRIALASALFGLIVAGGAIVVAFWGLSRQLDERSAAELAGKRGLLQHVLSEIPTRDAIAMNSHQLRDLLIGHDDLHLVLADPETNRVLAAFSDVARGTLTLPQTAGDNRSGPVLAADGKRLSTLQGTAPVGNGEPVKYLLALDRRHDSSLLKNFIKATLVGLPMLLLLVALGAWMIARTSLAPMRRFNRLAASIDTQSLGQRVSLAGLPSELADLSTEFNAMLQRIDDGYRRLEVFSGDLAHEMRTPVATLLGRTQVALSHNRSATQLQEVLEGNVDELERLGRLISDMLFIARSDQNEGTVHREKIELGHEAQRVADYLSVIADEKAAAVQVHGNAAAWADRLLIQRAITNLVSNAIRHAYAGTTVEIRVSEIGGQAALAVINRGEGIHPAHLGRIFDRFFRIDPARTRLDGGTGLGLAIVRSIVEAHGGNVSVSSEPGGQTIFTMVLPITL